MCLLYLKKYVSKVETTNIEPNDETKKYKYHNNEFYYIYKLRIKI